MNDKIQTIKALMKQKKYTYETFAVKIGKTKQTLVNYFTGRTRIDIDVIEEIARALEVPVSYFFEETGDRGSNTGTLNGNNIQGNNNRVNVTIEKQNNEIEFLHQKIQLLEDRIQDKNEIIKSLKEQLRYAINGRGFD